VSLIDLFLVCLKASMLSSGGLQALPILQDELLTQRGVLTNQDFLAAVAIGRVTPGPNGFFILSVGYYVAGLPGALMGALGLALPPFLAIGLVKAHRRLASRPWVDGLTRGIVASAIGLFCALGYSFTVPLIAEPASVAIVVVSLAVLLVTRVDALPLLGAGAVAGVVLYLLGIPLA